MPTSPPRPARAPRTGIIAAGNWIVDHVKVIDAWPPQDALANIRDEVAANGGAPYNVLKDLARLGARFPLRAVGLVGDDSDADYIFRDCRLHGIDTSGLRRLRGVPTSHTDVMTVSATGRRTFFHQRGANARLGPEHFDFEGTRARFFHLGYLLLLDRLDARRGDRPAAAAVLRRARRAGLRVSLDCVSENSNRFAAVVLPVLPDVDLLFVNDFEAERLSGIALRKGEALEAAAVEAAARALVAAGVRDWVIIHFPEGAFALSARGGSRWQGSVRVPAESIRGMTGAGDALAAGVLLGLHQEEDMASCLELGVAAAAACLQHATCSDGVRPAAVCRAQARRLGWRNPPSPAGASLLSPQI